MLLFVTMGKLNLSKILVSSIVGLTLSSNLNGYADVNQLVNLNKKTQICKSYVVESELVDAYLLGVASIYSNKAEISYDGYFKGHYNIFKDNPVYLQKACLSADSNNDKFITEGEAKNLFEGFIYYLINKKK